MSYKMNSRSKKRSRRWENDKLYWETIYRIVRRNRRRERGYLYIESDRFYDDFSIWAHEIPRKMLIHKGRKP